MFNEVEAAHRERLPRMKKSKTGVGSFYTHKMVLPGGIEGLGQPAYRVMRRQDEIIYPPEMMTRARLANSGREDRKRFLENTTKYYGKKVAV
jgi:hypothetical protein